jgi:hypothetical protein
VGAGRLNLVGGPVYALEMSRIVDWKSREESVRTDIENTQPAVSPIGVTLVRIADVKELRLERSGEARRSTGCRLSNKH